MGGTGGWQLALGCCLAGAGDAEGGPEPTNQELLDQMNRVWDTVVRTFYSPRTSLFYTSLPAQVPSAEQFRRGEPNVHAGGTGAEDCSMLGGILLAALCDQFDVTGDPAVGDPARMVFAGLKLAATVHGQPGFIARGVCEEDGRSIYAGTSRDQITHSLHGLWRYYHSPLSAAGERQAIRDICCAVADKMTREVTFEHGYSFRFAFGVADDRGVSRMRNVRTHEAARLPMFYAAAWDVARRDEHYRLYRDLLPLAVHQSLDFATTPEAELQRWVPAYSVLQMQASLELLLAVETDAPMAAAIRQALRQVAEYAEASPLFALQHRSHRDRAEVIEGQLMSPDYRLSERQEGYLRASIRQLVPADDPVSAYTLLGAYWRARRCGRLTP